MNINIDYGTRTPIYEQIVSEIERLVTLKILKSGEQIPSIRDLACTLGINPNTVKKSYDILENKGIIISKSTKGTFIGENVNNAVEAKIENLLIDTKNKIKELETYGLTIDEIIKRINKLK